MQKIIFYCWKNSKIPKVPRSAARWKNRLLTRALADLYVADLCDERLYVPRLVALLVQQEVVRGPVADDQHEDTVGVPVIDDICEPLAMFLSGLVSNILT